jgi:hypothetical protein
MRILPTIPFSANHGLSKNKATRKAIGRFSKKPEGCQLTPSKLDIVKPHEREAPVEIPKLIPLGKGVGGSGFRHLMI